MSITFRGRLGNTGKVYVGGSAVAANAGFELGPGEAISFNFSSAFVSGVMNDFYVDADVGIILAFEPDGNNPAGALGAAITYYAYDNPLTTVAKSQANAHRYVHFSKVPRPGTHVTYEKRLSNMSIQTPPFNYNGIMGVVGILVGIYIIVLLARRR